MRAENGQLRPEKRTLRRATSAEDAKLVLARGLLVIVGAEAIYPMENARLRRRGHAVGRLSVGVAGVSAVDQISILRTAIVASNLLSAT